MDPLTPIRLHNGTHTPRPIAINTYLMLRAMAHKNPLALLDLIEWAADPSARELHQDTLKVIPAGWQMGPSTSGETVAAIRACIAGSADDMTLRIVNPFTGE